MSDGGNTNLNITITSGTIVKTILFLLLFYALFILHDLVLILLTALVIASSVEPATRWFARYGVPRLPAVMSVYVIALTVVFGIFYFFVPPLLSESTAFLSQLPEYVERIDLESSAVDFGTVGTTQEISGGSTELPGGFTFAEVLRSLQEAASQLSSGVFQTVSTIFGGALSFLLIIIFSFYLAVQERGIDNFLRVITPVQHEEYIVDLWHRAQYKIGRWMQGQLLLVLLIGILTYLGLTILGVRHAFLLAVIAGMFELIPLFGPILGAIPAAIIGFVDGGLTLGLLVIGLFVILQQFENHLIYPLVVRKVVGVPALLVIVALIVGGKLAGFLGILLSVPVAAFLQELATDVQADKKRHVEQSEAPQ